MCSNLSIRSPSHWLFVVFRCFYCFSSGRWHLHLNDKVDRDTRHDDVYEEIQSTTFSKNNNRAHSHSLLLSFKPVRSLQPGHFPKCLTRGFCLSNAQEISPRCDRDDGDHGLSWIHHCGIGNFSASFGTQNQQITVYWVYWTRNMTGHLIEVVSFWPPLRCWSQNPSPGTKVSARPMAGPRDSICVRGTIPSMNFSDWLMLFQTQIRMIRDI